MVGLGNRSEALLWREIDLERGADETVDGERRYVSLSLCVMGGVRGELRSGRLAASEWGGEMEKGEKSDGLES